jgi:hypothetical protein
VIAIALLVLCHVVALGAWLWSLRDEISGPDVSTGVTLVGAPVVPAWLAGFAGARIAVPSHAQEAHWSGLGGVGST